MWKDDKGSSIASRKYVQARATPRKSEYTHRKKKRATKKRQDKDEI